MTHDSSFEMCTQMNRTRGKTNLGIDEFTSRVKMYGNVKELFIIVTRGQTKPTFNHFM